MAKRCLGQKYVLRGKRYNTAFLTMKPIKEVYDSGTGERERQKASHCTLSQMLWPVTGLCYQSRRKSKFTLIVIEGQLGEGLVHMAVLRINERGDIASNVLRHG